MDILRCAFIDFSHLTHFTWGPSRLIRSPNYTIHRLCPVISIQTAAIIPALHAFFLATCNEMTYMSMQMPIKSIQLLSAIAEEGHE
jgi:hypothetical protein